MIEVQEELDNFERGIGLSAPFPANEIEVNKLLSMDHSLMSKFTAEQCGEAALTLTQFSIHLQRAVNKLHADIRMYESSIKRIIAGKLNNTKGISFEERKMIATSNDDVASNLEKKLINTQLKLDRLSFLSQKIESFGKEFSNLYHRKSKY